MIISEWIDIIQANYKYVHNSLFLKSEDAYGCVYKWLEKQEISGNVQSYRKEMFIELDETETGELLTKTIINTIEVIPAQ